MRKKYEVELWAPDGIVACVRGATEVLSAHKYWLMWAIGVALIAFGASDGAHWYIWIGVALGLTALLREVFRDRNEDDLLEQWTIQTPNVVYWYVGSGMLATTWPQTGYMVVLGISILCHLAMLGIYHICHSDEVEKAEKKAAAEAKEKSRARA